ncbi:MAG: ThiF family adenylyltransferase [Anaeroplasmataceae bacterium]|nr:ThiF family adenylyltransferase [Anaeroplasmataceae bacterium]MDE6414327.1 ThiF family adenylyltransferase [Anaeroplasmataceae bacterium]
MEERSIPLLGEETIEYLKQAHIAVFGLGGVGGYVVEALARQGVGSLSIIDFDVITPSNKNRQILALESTIGHTKIEACGSRILDINPNAKVYAYHLKVDEKTIEQIDFQPFDYVVDCIDDIVGKLAIIKKAKEYGKKIISSCGTANKLDPTKFQIKDISKTSMCPLAKKLRLELKKLDIEDVEVLYSLEEPIVKEFDTLPSVSFVPSIAGLMIAGHIILKLQEEVKKNRIHLVLEGGGMKGVYTAGVLDFLLEQSLDFDAVYAVSAGACVGASYISKQITRGYHSLVDYVDNPACVSKRSLTKTGNYFNKEFIYYKIPNELIPYDYETANHNPHRLYATVTNVETGKAEYYPCLDYRSDIEYICASSSLPMLAEIQWLKGQGYLDGGIADSIPYLEAKKNAKKCVVVMTKPKGYLCQKQNPILAKAIQLKYRKYPKLLKALENRHIHYNKIVNLMEKDENVFIIRPSVSLTIDRLEKDKKKLEEAYQLGYQDAKASYEDLKKFLSK